MIFMALNGLFCADVPLRNYSLTRRYTVFLSVSVHSAGLWQFLLNVNVCQMVLSSAA